MSRLDGLEATFRKWGVPVVGQPLVDGRPGAFLPTHVMVHHTASAAGSGAVPSLRVVRDGRPGLEGPLCHVLVGRDLRVRVISREKANHAGAGSYPGIPTDQGNTRSVGIEIEHAGTAREPWHPLMRDFCRLVEAAVLDHLGQPATHLLAHKEWAPDRKIDPYGWNMDDERRAVARVLAAGPTSLEDDDMAMTPAERQALIRDIAHAVLTTPMPMFDYAERLYSDADGKMSVIEASQHAAAQALAANHTAGRALAAVEALQAAHGAQEPPGGVPGDA